MGRDLTGNSEEASANGLLIVEFVGLPGVGKSTLSRRVATMLDRDHFDVTEPISQIDERSTPLRILSKGRFAAKHAFHCPRAAINGIRTVQSTDQPTTGDYVRVGFNLQYVVGLVGSARSTSGVTLLDQGLYQALWSVGFRSPVDWGNLFARFEQLLSQNSPDLVVLVEAEHETITDRLRSRDKGDTRFAPDSSQFNRGVEGYEYIKEQVQSSDDAPPSIVVENETRADLAASAEQIAEAVSSISY